MITEFIFRTNSTKMLKWSLTGPTKNLHVKTGVLRMSVITRALHIWANSLFFIDLFQYDTSVSKADKSATAKFVLNFKILSEEALLILLQTSNYRNIIIFVLHYMF